MDCSALPEVDEHLLFLSLTIRLESLSFYFLREHRCAFRQTS